MAESPMKSVPGPDPIRDLRSQVATLHSEVEFRLDTLVRHVSKIERKSHWRKPPGVISIAVGVFIGVYVIPVLLVIALWAVAGLGVVESAVQQYPGYRDRSGTSSQQDSAIVP